MKAMGIFLFEFKHFLRSPFKVVATFLFLVAGIYGLHNGASVYQKQLKEIENINLKIEEQKNEILEYYTKGENGPANRPWINVTTPFWAIWNTPVYAFKNPSPTMVYSIGQTEQYGFYKRVTFWASTYDADMTQEISNPERIQIGSLDFSFVLLFLMPLLLLVLVYNLKSFETEQGFLSIIEVQNASKNSWIIAKMSFYVFIVFIICLFLLIYGATITSVFSKDFMAFWNISLYSVLYLLLWSIIFFSIIKKGKTIVSNTLKMIGFWIVFAFIIPACIHQYVGIVKPANLMIDFIDSQRDDQKALFEIPKNELKSKLYLLYPELTKSSVTNDSVKTMLAVNQSGAALANVIVKEASKQIETENQQKNDLISATFWFNPIPFFQNKFNRITKTHYIDYQEYRKNIQLKIDAQIKMMVLDMWNEKSVDKERYLEYFEILKN